MKITFFAILALALSAAAPSFAQGAGNSGGDRFVVTPVEGGVLRVDRLTGEVAFCSQSGGEWSCRQVEDQGSLGHGQAWRHRPAEEYDDMGEGGVMSKEEIDEAMDSFEHLMDRIIGAADRLEKYRGQPR